MVLLEKGDILPLFERYVLVETSMRIDQPYLDDILSAMIAKGWQPLLAHPERYRQWHNQRERYAELHELGVLFQINLLSLGGLYGSTQQQIAEQLIQQGWVHAIGSDLHRANQYKYIEEAKQNPHYKSMDGSKLLNNLFMESILSK
jgi:tyrosine-protein phosphatase YwqE